MNAHTFELFMWISIVAICVLAYKVSGKMNKRFENPILDERELLIRMNVEKIQWRVQATFLYLAVFLPLTFEYPIFWGIPRQTALFMTILGSFLAKLLADYFYRRETIQF
jgi:hypothetical protein